ncbi:hypothetical protein [Xanthobacter versatilis]|uniref:hypothetical protein n=1 Tax=Xanthobacter autotrophicus (strain ATCC BAA-1158 / Py2) TaxID=78245 RepID=UPI00372AA290
MLKDIASECTAGICPGTSDIVFPRRRKIIFVHGCFWLCQLKGKLIHMARPVM